MKTKRRKFNRKTIITLVCVAIAIMAPLAAGAAGAVIPAITQSRQETEQPDTATAETVTYPSNYAANRPLSGNDLTPAGLTEILQNLDYMNTEIAGKTVYLAVMKNEAGFPVCELKECTDSNYNEAAGQIFLDENSDLEEILSEIDETEFQYFLTAYIDMAASYVVDEQTEDPKSTPEPDVKILTNDVLLTTLHMEAGMISTNKELADILGDFDVAEVNIDGEVVYLPLIKDENGRIRWKQLKYANDLEQTLLGEVDPIGSDGNETGWAEALSEVSDEYSYALTADMDFENAYTLNENGEKVHFDIISG